ncbi:MAG: hypothetical protein J6K61_01215 [Clostridia bacterium]|nr:hypothetical protein [Clostridia bacterium]
MKKLMSILFAVCICLSVCGALSSCEGQQKTTVTEAEWNAAFEADNVTVEGFITERDEQESLLMKITKEAIYTENDGYISFVKKLEDGWHFYKNGQFGSVVNGVSASVRFAMQSFHLPEYASFIFDEETKSYVYINQGTSGFYQFNVYFENGVIVKIEGREDRGSVTHSFLFKNYGATVAEMPSENE